MEIDFIWLSYHLLLTKNFRDEQNASFVETTRCI